MKDKNKLVFYHWRLDEDPYPLYYKGYASYVPEAPNFEKGSWDEQFNFKEFCDGKSGTLVRNRILISLGHGVLYITLEDLKNKKDEYPFLNLLYNAYLNKDLYYQRNNLSRELKEEVLYEKYFGDDS